MSVNLEKSPPAPLTADKFSSEFTSWLAVMIDTLNEVISQIQTSLNNIVINKTGNIGGAGAGPIFVSVSGLTTNSIVVATIASSTNPVSVIKSIGTTNGFNVTFSGDPGASCVLNYYVAVTAQ